GGRAQARLRGESHDARRPVALRRGADHLYADRRRRHGARGNQCGAQGDHARLYELVYNRALASQMASARLERTTVDLTDGAGRAMLRATGQVVLFPGFT